MKITRRQLRQLINEESSRVLSESEKKRKSEMKQFVESRGGRKMEGAGQKISSGASIISGLASEYLQELKIKKILSRNISYI